MKREVASKSDVELAKKIWDEHNLEAQLYWHEEMWTDHEFDPSWGEVQYDGWHFYTTENSDFVVFTTPDDKLEGEFIR
jgi:hypothetical protein